MKNRDNQWDEFIRSRNRFSLATFGSGTRVPGIIKHIRKELEEIEENPTDPLEWVDVIFLALDGMARQGHGTPEQVLHHLQKKLKIVQAREWPVPDPEGLEPVEHFRTGEKYMADYRMLERAFSQHNQSQLEYDHLLADCWLCGSKEKRPKLVGMPKLFSYNMGFLAYCPSCPSNETRKPIMGNTAMDAVDAWNAKHRGDAE